MVVQVKESLFIWSSVLYERRRESGSTAIILFGENTLDWNPELDTGSQVQIGQALGHYR